MHQFFFRRNDDHGASNDKDACRENSARGRDLAEINCNGSPSKNKSKKRKRRMVHDPTVKVLFLSKYMYIL